MRRLVVVGVLVLVMVSALAAAELPLTRVELFTSGVGYFERQGAVDGSTTVELSFRTAQINDILKSLVVQDLSGGTIAPVTYAPQEPLERTLSSFTVNIADNPGLRQLWDRIRGTAVRLTVKGAVVEGIAFGSEVRQKQVEEATITVEYLNLQTHKGLMQFAVPEVESIKLLDPKVEGDLQKALAAIDKSRDTDRRPVTLSFKGQGKRDVSVGYLLETPVWKTTYRLVIDKDGLFLQGWALVENTTDDDWSNIGLSLISGRPVSFTQDLYQPLYVPRPDIPVQVAAAARPRVYEGALERKADEEQAADAVGFGGGGGMGGGRAGVAAKAVVPQAGMPGMPGAPGMAAPAPPPTARRMAGNAPQAMAQGGQVGTLFQYAISQPVTIPRQRSAMIPIINEKVQGEKVSVYNQYSDPRHPMNGVRLKNTSKLHLMGGPITVFDGNAYGGDSLIEDVPPGDERLLTYAMDLAVEVEPRTDSQPDRLLTGKIVNGVMTLTWKNRKETTYNVKNNGTEKRTVLIEHPLQSAWDLIEPKQADERTRTAYRFRVVVEPKQTGKLTVVEESPRVQEIRLLSDSNAPRLFIQQQGMTDKMKAALAQIIKLQDEQAGVTAQRTERETRIKEIETEQERIRNNMKELDRNSELYKQYVTKLTAQETEFEKLRSETKDLRAQETAKAQEIANFVNGLNIE